MSDDLYRRAGVEDLAEFYRTKFVSGEVLDARYFRALDRFDMRFARTMWVYDNVRAGSAVLDLGCGAGMLALLKRKGVTLAGVDLSEECAHAARLRRFFAHVAWEPRYALCLSSEEFIKQHDEYGLPFESDFVEYLRGLSFSERRAFDMAMGYVFGKISDLHVRLPKSGLYVLLKASDAPLGSFYNEHRDRSALFTPGGAGAPLLDEPRAFCLDRAAEFDEGWYEPNMLPPVARWMGGRGRVRFR